MNTNNKFLRKVLCLFFICILFVSNSVISFAVEDEDKFYTNDDDALEDLFSMTLSDVYGDIKDPLGWISDGHTFVVIREYIDNYDNTRYKIYVNTPDIPQYLQNLALKTVGDGWEDKTFEPESRLIEEVGKNDDNVINKFGFNIAINKYQGEYPRLYMTLAGILPVKWYQKIWRGLKALVGLSFVNAPDKDNFKTLNYYNHQYSEVDEDLIDFIQEYWLEYFVGVNGNGIWMNEDDYFRDAEDFKAQLITKDEIEEAKNFKNLYANELEDAHNAIDAYNDWYDECYNYEYVYNHISSFKSAIDTLQANIDNETDATQKAQYEQQLLNKKGQWEDYLDSAIEHGTIEGPPEVTAEQQDWLNRELQAENLVERYKDFEARWNAGYNKNKKGYKDGGYEFSYAQCLLDISEEVIEENGGNDCTRIVDGQTMSGSVADIFVNSGLYRIGLTKESKKESADANGGTETFPASTSYRKLGTINQNTGNRKNFAPPSGIGAGCAQSFAYVDGGYAVTYVTQSSSPSYVVYYDSNGNVKGYERKDTLNHGNAACSTHDGKYMVAGTLGSDNGQTGYVFDVGNSVNYKKKVDLPASTSAMAYDKDTGKYILATGRTMRVYDSDFSTRFQSINRNMHGRFYQDIGAGGGYIFACHTKVKGGANNGMNYIDIYNETSGDYCGTYEVPYGEIESVDVVNGELVLLMHIKGSSINYVQHSGVILNGVAGGSTHPLEYKEDGLTRTEAIKIITLLQSKCGPTYREVMENIVTCMIQNAAHAGEEIELEEYIDPRVMPYDRDTLIPSGGGGTEIDGDNIHISDPRVDIYKTQNIIGAFIVDGTINFDFILKNRGVTRLAINFCGVLAEWSIFLNQITNFQVLDDVGLSPTTMWQSASSTVVIILLMMILIINIVIYAFKFIRGKAGIGQILGRVGLFIGLMALVILLTDPSYSGSTWNTYKKLFNKINNVGETTIVSTMDNVEELYGDEEDSSVTYYLTYFNLWTLYNTGYNLSAPEQIINEDDPEAEEIQLPEIAGRTTSLWPVVLADSFNRNGDNPYSMGGTGKNGLSVNPNAYRTVDHFLAPRLYTNNPKNGSLNMTNTVNENFNGKFQKVEVFTALGSMVNAINLFIIALIKAVTFLWMWYLLYIFIFNIILGALEKRNGLKNVIIRTLSPILAMAVIGAWAGIVIQVSMLSEGFINFVINFALLWLTFRFLCSWQRSFALSFPAPLKYLTMLVDSRERSSFRTERSLRDSEFEHRRESKINQDAETGRYNEAYIDDVTGNYIGGKDNTEYKEKYNRIIANERLKAQRAGSYEAIKDERIRYKIQQLDRQNECYGQFNGGSYLSKGNTYDVNNEIYGSQSQSQTQTSSSGNNSNKNNNTPNKGSKYGDYSNPTRSDTPTKTQTNKNKQQTHKYKDNQRKIGEGGKKS